MGLPSAQVKQFHFLSSYFSRNRLNDLWTLTPGTNRPNVFSDLCRHHDVRQHHQRHSAPADQSELTNVKFHTGTNLPIIYINTLQVNPDWLSSMRRLITLCRNNLIQSCPLILVPRTSECLGSSGSIMWRNRSSNDLDWRLSFRSVTRGVCKQQKASTNRM